VACKEILFGLIEESR